MVSKPIKRRRETKFIYRIYLGPPPRDDPDDELPLPIEELPPLEPRVGLEIELDEIRESIKNNEEALIKQIKQNQEDQLGAGHHGVPLCVYKDEYFFGQDKFDDLINRMKSNGDI